MPGIFDDIQLPVVPRSDMHPLERTPNRPTEEVDIRPRKPNTQKYQPMYPTPAPGEQVTHVGGMSGPTAPGIVSRGPVVQTRMGHAQIDPEILMQLGKAQIEDDNQRFMRQSAESAVSHGVAGKTSSLADYIAGLPVRATPDTVPDLAKPGDADRVRRSERTETQGPAYEPFEFSDDFKKRLLQEAVMDPRMTKLEGAPDLDTAYWKLGGGLPVMPPAPIPGPPPSESEQQNILKEAMNRPQWWAPPKES